MPTYAYACTDCDHSFEAVQKFSDDSLTECPQCHGRLRKVYTNVGVVFKGSGFYRNDSRTESGAAKNGAAKDGSGTDGAKPGEKSSQNGSDKGSDKGSTKGAEKSAAKTGGSSDSSSSTGASSSPAKTKSTSGSAA